jgi:hypothetical protein
MWTINDADYNLTEDGLVKRQKGLYDAVKKKMVLFFPERLYPIIAFFIIGIRRIVVIGKKI